MLLWHAAAILLTAISVLSGFDWLYFRETRGHLLWSLMFPAAVIGMFLPAILPIALIIGGLSQKDGKMFRTGWAIGQAEFMGWLISSAYKAVTGRVHPAHVVGEDISRVFKFGFLRGGVFWGWPSSHTTVAFAMAATIFTLFPKQRWLGVTAFVYAFYIGLGVSVTIHWFSDFAAGAIIGTVIGTIVGRSFLTVEVN